MSYAATQYLIDGWQGPGNLGRPVLFLAGASSAGPSGSNLPFPAPVGRYGAFVGPSGANIFTASATSTRSKQLPMRFGKNHAWVSFTLLTRGTGAGGAVQPAYGN
jgi:hypothetical protein